MSRVRIKLTEYSPNRTTLIIMSSLVPVLLELELKLVHIGTEMGVCFSCNFRRDRDLLLGTEGTQGGNKLVVGQPVWEGSTDVTRDSLEARRKEFWDTAPAFGGREEVWTALRSACEFAEKGDYSMSQAIVDGAGIILPSGYLSESYDELGHSYIVPNYCLARPKSLKRHSKQPSLSPRSGTQEADTQLTEIRDTITDTIIRIRLDSGRDVKLEVSSEDTICHCKKRLSRAESVAVSPQVWCYSGKVLKDSQTVRGLNIPSGHVVQVCMLK